MAYKQPPKDKQFKKGVSGNPLGAKLANPAIRALKKLTLDTYREVIELVLTGNLAAVQEMIKNPKTPAIQVGVATAFVKAIQRGDYTIIEKIAERIVGKIPDELNVRSTNLNANANTTPKYPGEHFKKMKAILEQLESDV